LHVVDPLVAINFPRAQKSQIDAPSKLEYFPASHCKHVLWFTAPIADEYLPLSQSQQFSKMFVLQDPVLQRKHWDLSTEMGYKPFSHD